MLEKITNYVSKQVYMNRLIARRNTRNLDSSFSADKTTLVIVEQVDSHNVIKTYNKNLSCPENGYPNAIYKRGPSFTTNNYFTDIETISVTLNRDGEFLAYINSNLATLYKISSNGFNMFVASFPIKKFNNSGNYFNRSVEFNIDYFDDKESLLIFDDENTITIVENFEQGRIDEMIITEHKLNKVKALFYDLLQRVLFKIC